MTDQAPTTSRTKILRWFLPFGLTCATVVALGFLVAVFGVTDKGWLSLCATTELERYASPNNLYDAVVFTRDCGATTGFSTQVSILDFGQELPNDGGNVFVSDTNHGAAPTGPGRGPEVRIEWLSDDEVLIHYHKSARTFKQENEHAGLVIHYESFD